MVDKIRAEGEAQLAACWDRFDPAVAKLGKALRRKLRARLPGLHEVVYLYEGRGSLVISYSASGKGYDAPCTLSIEGDRVKLFFAHGPQLAKSHPNTPLQGTGKLVRYVELKSAVDLARPVLETLIVASLKLSSVHPDAKAQGSLILKIQSQQRRAARVRRVTTRSASSPKNGRVSKKK